MASVAELEFQTSQVMEWLTEGYSRQEIVEKGTRMFECKVRKIDDLISKARQQFVDNVSKIDRKQIVAEAIERYDYLYRKGVEQRQLAVSIAAQQAKMKMIGADAPRNSN